MEGPSRSLRPMSLSDPQLDPDWLVKTLMLWSMLRLDFPKDMGCPRSSCPPRFNREDRLEEEPELLAELLLEVLERRLDPRRDCILALDRLRLAAAALRPMTGMVMK